MFATADETASTPQQACPDPNIYDLFIYLSDPKIKVLSAWKVRGLPCSINLRFVVYEVEIGLTANFEVILGPEL